MSRRRTVDDWWLVTVDVAPSALGDHVPEAAIPDEARRTSLKVGELAALVLTRESAFADAYGKHERLWLEVIEVTAEGTYVGALENQPTFIRGLDAGTELAFGPEHVFGAQAAPKW